MLMTSTAVPTAHKKSSLRTGSPLAVEFWLSKPLSADPLDERNGLWPGGQISDEVEARSGLHCVCVSLLREQFEPTIFGFDASRERLDHP